jgi:tripartite-type tricarboxylate transporter receptor subunit TctC
MISGNAANAALYPNLDFNFVRDIVPVAFLGYTPFVVVVHPSVAVKTLSQLIVYASAAVDGGHKMDELGPPQMFRMNVRGAE